MLLMASRKGVGMNRQMRELCGRLGAAEEEEAVEVVEAV